LIGLVSFFFFSLMSVSLKTMRQNINYILCERTRSLFQNPKHACK
jgi:hypothetical protein